MTRGAIIQPSFLPWRGFFDIIHRSDIFVFLDDVQFDKHSWRNRNKIKTANGTQWVTVPVLVTGKFGQKILETKIRNNISWKKKILNAIYYSYKKSTFFEEYFPTLEESLSREWDLIADLDIFLTEEIMKMLGIKTVTCRSSVLGITAIDKNERILQICQKAGISCYISGPSAKDYMNSTFYKRNGITVEFMDYNYPSYQQLYRPFDPQVSIIDLLFNMGPEAPRYIWGHA